VLLIIDEADYLEVRSGRLEVRGIAVKSAPDGPSAVEKLRESKFATIILDRSMPTMDFIKKLVELDVPLEKVYEAKSMSDEITRRKTE
jgi:CheY-like chemotaxis protein